MAHPTQTYAMQPLLAHSWPKPVHACHDHTQTCSLDHPTFGEILEQENGSDHNYQTPLEPRSIAKSCSSPTSPDIQPIVSAEYCAPFTTTFFVKDRLLSWSGSDANILNEHGNIAFVVDGKTLSLRGSRALRDVAGHAVCVLQPKV